MKNVALQKIGGVALIKQVFNEWEDSQNAYEVFCNLYRTFSCVHHNRFLRRLGHCGIQKEALKI